MYVVDALGETDLRPEGSTVPTPLLITTPVALVEFQERVVDFPFSMAAGETFNETVGAGISGFGGGGGGSSTGAGGGGATFFLHPTPVTIRAAIANITHTSVALDLPISASPSLVLRFNPDF